MKADYTKWRKRLAGETVAAFTEPDENDVGFYRLPIREKQPNGRWKVLGYEPVALFVEIDALLCQIGSASRSPVSSFKRDENWPWFVKEPISEETWRAVAERGDPWPDAKYDQEIVPASNREVSAADNAVPEQPLDVQHATAIGQMREQIATALKGVPTYSKIESEDASVAATGLRNLLNELAGDADKARVAEKEPFLEGGRKVDAKYKKLIDSAKAGALEIKKARDVWEDTKREAARQASLRAAEEQRRIDEEAAHRDISETIPVVQVKSNLPPPAAQIRPTYGRAASVGTKMVVTELDAMKFIAALKPRSEWSMVFEFLMEFAQKLANKGVILDGVTVQEKADTK